ncbi:hypothetical protein CK203_106698 [Vitis vinifera]|uniref:Uncharacterized protein n=1 Tax=Vitis vinifera TaxID=29760 RepID=A0A438DK12_VITVI|nr:hypothetical protein CK203_106698 [Vitis vinifera]
MELFDIEGDDNIVDNDMEHHPFANGMPNIKYFNEVEDYDEILQHRYGRLNQEEIKSRWMKRKENRRLLHQKVGEGYVQLVSYLGVLAQTMVLVYHTDWRIVPMELKEKLWDCVKMQKTGSRKPIDRWVLWKLARLKKCEYDDVTRPVAEKIAVEERKITCVGQKDILNLALGTSEHPRRVRGNVGKKSPNNSSTHQNPQKLLKKRNVKGC